MNDRYLIFGYSGIGNFVLKTPMLQKLRVLYPEAAVDLITDRPSEGSFLKEAGLIDRILPLSDRASKAHKIKFFRGLKGQGYKAAFISFDALGGSIRWGTRLAGIPQRFVHILPQALDKPGTFPWSLLFDRGLHPVPILPGRHETDLHMDLLEAYHAKPMTRNIPTYVKPPQGAEVLEKHTIPSPYILIQPGGANGQLRIKSLAEGQFREILEELLRRTDHPLVITGDKGDRKMFVEPVIEAFRNEKRVVDTSGKTSLGELIQLIHGASLVIGTDSGPMHLAEGLGKPLIALFGPTDHTRTRPLKGSAHLLFSKNEFFASMYGFRRTQEEIQDLTGNKSALDAIDPGEVAALAERVLHSTKLSSP